MTLKTTLSPDLALAGATATTGLSGCDGDSGDSTTGRDLPEDPNNPGEPVDSSLEVTDRIASDGDRAIACTIDGSADDGTIWVEQRVDLSGVNELTVAGYSAQESFNTIAKLAVYAGPDPERDLTESDFDTTNATEDREGWKDHSYAVEHDDPGLVAVGISVVWETEVTRVLDDVRLS